MTRARIYQPAKTAMQSGRGNTEDWVLEFEPASAKTADPLMGWTGSTDPDSFLRLAFSSRDDAIAYAERSDIAYEVREPKERRIRPKNYADKFRWDRVA